MIDSINNSTNLPSTLRSQSLTQVSRARSTEILPAVQQSQQKTSGGSGAMTAFAVPQTGKSGATSTPKLPRGSLVDVLA